MSKAGVYVGNSPSTLREYENWLGREADFLIAFLDHQSWEAFEKSIAYNLSLWPGEAVHWSVPLVTVGSSLKAAASGTYNAQYLKVATALAAATPGSEPITIRPGWEFNGDWYPWKAAGQEQAYIGAFRQLVETFRSVSDRFVFEWTPTVGTGSSMDPAKAYPGDAYVDVIGMNFYYNTAWDPKDPAAAWDSMVNRPYGLQWHQDFATAHSKPTAHSEWGINSDNAAPYLERAASWFERHEVLYQAYWNSNADFKGKLSAGQHPGTGEAYKQAFGGASPYRLSGTAENDLLTGSDRGELIAGRAGADRMSGGRGDDTYILDDAGDLVFEFAGQGTDEVRSFLARTTLAAEVENLRLVGGGDQEAVGNALANRIVGGAGANRIEGLAGNDHLAGGLGGDTFVFRPGSGRDVIADFSPGQGDVVRLENFGFTSSNQIQAALAAHPDGAVLSLPTGDSIQFRGLTPGQLTAERFVFSGDLPGRPAWNPVEPALAPTEIQTWKTGTAAPDTLTGGSYNNYLDGKGGADTLIGGGGHDVYVVDVAGDVVLEYAGDGVDSVTSWAPSYALPAHVEHLSLAGSYAQTGIGNDLANRISGGAGANVLDGRGGDDLLKGGGGPDIFLFRPGSDHDIIADFAAGSGVGDAVRLEGSGWASFDQVRAALTAVAEGTVLTLSGGDTILFRGVGASQFAADDFLL